MAGKTKSNQKYFNVLKNNFIKNSLVFLEKEFFKKLSKR